MAKAKAIAARLNNCTLQDVLRGCEVSDSYVQINSQYLQQYVVRVYFMPKTELRDVRNELLDPQVV